MKTTVYIVRHGEAEGNIGRVFHGITDSDLTPNGVLQAKEAAKRFREIPLDAAYSSPISRAYHTALEIVSGHGLTVTKEPELCEVNGGEWENVPFDEIARCWPVEFEAFEEREACQIPGGESLLELRMRGAAAIKKIAASHPGQTVLIVTHGTLIRSALEDFLPEERHHEIDWQDNTAVTKLILENGVWEASYIGDNSHLKELSTLNKQSWWLKRKGKNRC